MSLLTRLRERKLVQWALAYLAGAWVLLEATGFVSDRFAWPEVIVRALTILAGVGFFVTLVLAWYHGEKGQQKVTGPELLLIAGLLGIAGGLMAILARPDGDAEAGTEAPAFASMSSLGPASVAVLPFTGSSATEEDQTDFFVDGIHSEILTQLSKIASLEVIGQTSVMRFVNSDEPVQSIGALLGVASLLEGTVLRAGERVRINVRLLDAGSGREMWAEAYERELTVEQLFAIQADIALRIANALQAALAPRIIEQVAERPTENLEAYEHYLRGKAYQRRRGAGSYGDGTRAAMSDSSMVEYERAVELDPEFSAAWAALATVRNAEFYVTSGRRIDRDKVEQALARAVELAPESYETQMAQAHYYRLVGEDPARAMTHLRVAETLRPNDQRTSSAIAGALRLQGKWEEALTYYETAAQLDPQNLQAVRSVAVQHQRMRHFEEAERYLDRLVAMDPSATGPLSMKFNLYTMGLGDTVKARALAERHPERSGWQADLHYYRREYEQAIEIYRSHPPTNWFVTLLPLYLTGRLEEARAYADSVADARADGQQRETEAHRESLTAAQLSFRRSQLGLALAFAGKIEAAIRVGEEALELYPAATDEYNYQAVVWDLCNIYMLASDHDAAIDQLEVLLSTPTLVTVAGLQIDPFYDTLRDHPRFQALLEKHSEP